MLIELTAEIEALRETLRLKNLELEMCKREILEMFVTVKDQKCVSLDAVADILGVERLTKQDKINIVESKKFGGNKNGNS